VRTSTSVSSFCFVRSASSSFFAMLASAPRAVNKRLPLAMYVETSA